MHLSDFDYYLPPEFIAQTAVEPRDWSRLMVLKRETGIIKHHHFGEIIDFLHAGDLMVFNDSRVIPARLNGHKMDTGAKCEIFLLRKLENGVWETLVPCQDFAWKEK